MTKNELIWLVGFFEGEGSCGAYTKTCYSKAGKKYVYPRGSVSVNISQKDETIIRWIQKLLGYGSIQHRVNPKSSFGKELWCWEASHNDAKRFLTMVQPYLRIDRRKKQVQEALS